MIHLVTGASGFVGSHLVKYLLANDNSVRALVRSRSQVDRFREMGVQAILGDLSDSDILHRAVRNTSTIYHCAAASSLSSDDEIRRTNLDGVRNLLHAVHDEKAGRVVLMSSLNVFGTVNYDNVAENFPTVRTGDVYTDVKIDGEEIALQFVRHHNLDITIFRPGLIYGPGGRYMTEIAAAILQGKFIFIGSRHNLVPLIYINDMVQVMVKSVRSRGASRHIYNIADGSRTTIGNLADTIAKRIGARSPKRVIPYLLPRVACTLFRIVGRPVPISPATLRFLGTSRHVSIHRAQTELGFDPKSKLQQGISETTASWHNQSLAKMSEVSRAA